MFLMFLPSYLGRIDHCSFGFGQTIPDRRHLRSAAAFPRSLSATEFHRRMMRYRIPTLPSCSTRSPLQLQGVTEGTRRFIYDLCPEKNVYFSKYVISCLLHTWACILVAGFGFRGWSCACSASIRCLLCLRPGTGLGTSATRGTARSPRSPCIPLTVNCVVVVVVVVGWNLMP